MGCQSEVFLGNYLTFSVCTHDPATAILTDADSDPSYRIYEDETAGAIATGTMSKLDDVNTIGFYTERVACTTLAGFEVGKSYTVYIEATVLGSTGGICYSFRVTTVGLGAGAIEFIYTLTDIATGFPIDGATVWATTDLAGLNVVASGTTDLFGQVHFWLDVGTYYFWRQKAGWTFVEPDIEQVV